MEMVYVFMAWFLMLTFVNGYPEDFLKKVEGQDIFSASQITHISTNKPNAKCQHDLMGLFTGLAENQIWAQKFLDAMGKPPAGIYMISNQWTGSYDECINIKAKYNLSQQIQKFNGQYCVTQINIPLSLLYPGNNQTFPLKLGVCIPDSCLASDVKEFLQWIEAFIPAQYRIILDHILGNGASYCVPKGRIPDIRYIVGLTICSVFLLIMVISTAYDIYQNVFFKKIKRNVITIQEPAHESNGFEEGDEDYTSISNLQANGNKQDVKEDKNDTEKHRKGRLERMLLSFSVYTNGMKILNTERQAEGTIPCLHGVRFLSMSWVILGHTYYFPLGIVENIGTLGSILDNFAFQAISNGGGFAVDSFFLLRMSIYHRDTPRHYF